MRLAPSLPQKKKQIRLAMDKHEYVEYENYNTKFVLINHSFGHAFA
jgi:hypothetical protein